MAQTQSRKEPHANKGKRMAKNFMESEAEEGPSEKKAKVNKMKKSKASKKNRH